MSRTYKTIGCVSATLAAAVILAVSTPAGAMPALGTNAVLDGNGGDLYIPLKPSTSGELGDPLGGGDYVGLQSDSVTLSAFNPNSSGYVEFELIFDLTVDLGVFPSMDRDSTALMLTFDDIDFKTDVYSNYTLNEILSIEFRDDPNGPSSGTTLVMDDTNYWNYSGMAPNHATDNVTVTYEINLKDDLGIGEADFLDMEGDKDFALWVRFSSDLHYTGGYLGCASVNNTSEAMNNRFTLVGVPEPATVTTLIGLGAVGLLRRKRSV
jgi:hypothetical protein